MNFEKIEAIFFNVLEDIHDYLPDLTLVGGWMPYIYTNFLWKTFVRNPITTVDIDFGIDQSITREYSKTIFETLFFGLQRTSSEDGHDVSGCAV